MFNEGNEKELTKTFLASDISLSLTLQLILRSNICV